MVYREAFDLYNMIYLQRKPQNCALSSRWFNIHECNERKIDVCSEYPECKYLFRCLLNTGENEIGPLITKVTSINSTTKLSDISNIFKQVSETIPYVSHNKAAKSLKCFRSRKLFPITNKKKHLHDSLCMIDDVSWFIADRAHLWESFGGKLPLLAFSIKDLAAMENLINSLNFDCRRLSQIVQIISGPKGLISDQTLYTKSLRAKSGFIKA